MKICFVLPKFTRQPIGGYKIVFEYANRFIDEGNEVCIVFINEEALQQFKLPRFVRGIMASFITKIEPKWFPLNVNIKKYSSTTSGYLKNVNDSDIVFATGIQTVEIVKENFKKAKKFYLIQGYENWGVSEEYLWSTYNCGFTNIVVSNWLKSIVDEHSNSKSLLLKNPIDVSVYECKVNQSERKNHTIGLLYHTEPIKGLEYAFKALYKLKDMYSDLEVEMFGMFPVPKNLPKWINYKRGASQEETVEVYNKVHVFLCASVEEGYGLTGLEAMACGACLVSTAYKGVLEYAENDVNALLSPVKDVDGLVQNVIRLFESSEETKRISEEGVRSVKQYSWRETMVKLNNIVSIRRNDL